jgi:hypothetical protein
MYLGFFSRKGLAYIPVVAITKAGFHLAIEPIEVVTLTDTRAFVSTLKKVISKGNPIVPAPNRDQYGKPAVLRYANVRSWSEFERDSRYWTLSKENGTYKFTPWKKRSDRGFEEDLKKVVSFPADYTIDDILEFVVRTVQSRSTHRRPKKAS